MESNDDEVDRVREKLLALGDPSGRQDCAYWNEWFEAVCYNNDSGERSSKSFEWYCDVDIVSRILTTYLAHASDLILFHPGSGNSTLPVHLKDHTLRGSRHVIMDISDLAMTRMKCHHANDTDDLQFIIGNVLDKPLPFPSNYFDAWLDKGLIDALFSDKPTHSAQCQDMMLEAHRILKQSIHTNHQPDPEQCSAAQTQGQSGIVCIVTMAQTHSLRLILDAWVRTHVQINQSDTPQQMPLWKTHLHIHEVEPSTGTRRPFVFVLEKYNALMSSSTHNHNHNNRIDTLLVSLHTALDHTHTITLRGSDEDMLSQVQQLLDTSSQTLRNKLTKENLQRIVFTKLHIKPRNNKIDLQALHDSITRQSWGLESLSWYPTALAKTESHNLIFPQNIPLSCVHILKHGYIEDIGYGISKLVLICTVASDDLDHLCETLLHANVEHVYHSDGNKNLAEEMPRDDDDDEYEYDDEDENLGSIIQSVDIDWNSTIPVGDLAHVLRRL